MPRYPYHVASEEREQYPLVADLPTVDAATPLDAVATLARAGKLPVVAGDTFWLRIVIEAENGCPKRALAFPLTPAFEIPIDWQPADDGHDAD